MPTIDYSSKAINSTPRLKNASRVYDAKSTQINKKEKRSKTKYLVNNKINTTKKDKPSIYYKQI